MKVILSDNTVIAIKDDGFSLAPTDTDVAIMSWTGDEPALGHKLIDGAFISAWAAMNQEAVMKLVRSERDAKLSSTDFMIGRHSEQQARSIPTSLSPADYNQLLAYRQALRDFTTTVNLNVDSFDNITWPTKPSFV